MILGENQLDRIIKDAKRVKFFNQARPHQRIEQKIPEEGIQVAENKNSKGKIIAFPVLNGLLVCS